MAIYHFSAQVLGRSTQQNPDGTRRPGSCAVAAAAYRSGEKLTDRGTSRMHDYSNRKGVAHSEIMTPPGSAPWLEDRETLWNTVEAMEKRTDAQLAREFNMALPHELDADQRLELVRGFVDRHFVQRGMVADLALHDPIAEQGQNGLNFHAHVMLTLRRATRDGLDPVKTREWNSRELLVVWRAEWSLACNAALERAGKSQRVDHRTLQAQREDAVKRNDRAAALVLKRTPEIHVGPKAKQIEGHSRVPVSRDRYVGAERKSPTSPTAKRRKRAYTISDHGSRLHQLRLIIYGNNAELKRDMREIDRRFDRIERKLDYWNRRVTFKAEGLIRGKEFRFQRWKTAEAEKIRQAEIARQAAHARKRLGQLRDLLKALENVARLGTRRREQGLVRAREVEGWIDAVTRLRSRNPSRSRGGGRSRKRT